MLPTFAASGHTTLAQPPTTAPPLAALQHEIAAAVAEYPIDGEYAVATTDLQTRETISVNGDRPQLAACSINFLVLLRIVADVQAGRYPLSAVDRLIARTLYSSNPVTARDLYKIAGDGDVLDGMRRVTSLIDSLGLEDTVLDHPPGYQRESLHPNPDDGNTWMTANDANTALEQLYADSILDPAWRYYLLDAMTKVKPGLNYLTANGPDDVATVSHKNGFAQTTDGKWIDNDIGSVRFERGDRTYAYAISFFSQWVPEKYDDIPLGAEVSRLAWAYFCARYP